jgi:glucan biosynthesis protein C
MGGGVKQAGEREHHWDTVRAFLMLLGIPFHVALAYRAGHVWIVEPSDGAVIFTYIAECIHIFRMPAFFVVAGYFAGMLLMRRSPVQWLGGRFMRLGVPLVAAMLTLVPIMNIMCELSVLPAHAALLSFKAHSLTSGGYWVRHLWFLVVLLQCSSIATAIAWWKPCLAIAILSPRMDAWIARHFLPCLVAVAIIIGLWEAASIELFYMASLATNVPQEILRIDDFLAAAPYFALGVLVQRAPATLARFNHLSLPTAVLALLALALGTALVDQMLPPVGRFVGAVGAVLVTQVLLALAKRLADRRIPLVDRLVQASFVIYLVHLPLIIIMVTAVQTLAVPVELKAMAMMGVTFGLSWAAWRGVEGSPLLRFLFDGVRVERERVLRPSLA